MKTIPIVFLLLVASTAFADDEVSERRVKQPYDRYASIVDRQMFGPLPPGFDPTKSPSEVSKTVQKELTQEQEKLQSSIHFSMINLTPDGKTAVGFTDNSDPKTPVSYYLKVGEERNGWKVLEADATTATMRIAKGDIEVSLTIGGNSAAGGTTARATAPETTSRASRHSGLGGKSGLLGSGSLRARRAKREAARKQAEEEQTQRNEAEKAEREAEKEAEKAQREAEQAERRQMLENLKNEIKALREKSAENKEAADSGRESDNANNDAE